MKYPGPISLRMVEVPPLHIDIDAARQAIDQAEENTRELVEALRRKQEIIKRCRKAMLRVTFNRIAPGEWEHIDKGLMDALHREVHGEGE